MAIESLSVVKTFGAVITFAVTCDVDHVHGCTSVSGGCAPQSTCATHQERGIIRIFLSRNYSTPRCRQRRVSVRGLGSGRAGISGAASSWVWSARGVGLWAVDNRTLMSGQVPGRAEVGAGVLVLDGLARSAGFGAQIGAASKITAGRGGEVGPGVWGRPARWWVGWSEQGRGQVVGQGSGGGGQGVAEQVPAHP